LRNSLYEQYFKQCPKAGIYFLATAASASLLKALGQEKDQKFYREALELYCLYDTDLLVLNMDNIKTSLSHCKDDEVALLKHLKLEIQ
jgi:hypothetical protein